MSSIFRRIHCGVERKQSIEQGRLAIETNLVEPAAWNRFPAMVEEAEPEQRWRILAYIEYGVLSHVPENIAGSGMVQSRVSFSLDCQSLAQTDSDQSTTPASLCGHDPSNPRPKYPRSMCQNVR